MCRALRIVLPIAFSLYWTMPLVSQSPHGKLRLVQQLGSPISIDEAELGNDNVLRWARVTNESDRRIKSMTLGCVSVSIRGNVHAEVGALNPLGDLVPGASTNLRRQTVGCSPFPGVKSVVVVFVAKATYEGGNEYVADIPAIEREMSRMSNVRKSS